MSLTPEDLLKEARTFISEIDSQEAYAITETDNPFIIDVREPAERIEGFIPASTNIPRGVLEFKITNHEEVNNKKRPILVYCETGMRGALATYTLRKMGFSNARNLIGGFQAWKQVGLSVDRDPDAW